MIEMEKGGLEVKSGRWSLKHIYPTLPYQVIIDKQDTSFMSSRHIRASVSECCDLIERAGCSGYRRPRMKCRQVSTEGKVH